MSRILSSKKFNSLSKEGKNEVIQILSQLIEIPFSIAGIENDFKDFGKKTVREITRSTVYSLVVILIFIQLTLTFFWLSKGINYLNTNWGTILFHPFSTAVWPYLVFFLFQKVYLKIKQPKFKKDGDENKYAEALLNGSIRCNNLVKYFYKVIPFTFRTIWIWTLIFGVATVFTADDLSIDIHSKINPSSFNLLTSGLLKAIIISIIAYIATNIIHELLQLREQYVKGLDEMRSLEETIESSNDEMKSLKDTIGNSSNVMSGLLEQSKTALNYADASHSITEFIDNANDEIIKTQALNYVDALASLTKAMTSKIKHIDNKIHLSLLSSYKSLLDDQAKRTIEGKPILTTWNNLGTISKNLVKNIHGNFRNGDGYELVFYALQLKSPALFVNAYFEPNNSEWIEFINFNIINNHVNRYFAVINDSVNTWVRNKIIDSLKVGTEKNSNIFKEFPYYNELDSISENKIKLTINSIDYYYNKNRIDTLKNSKERTEELLFLETPNDNFEKIALKELLNNVIHEEGTCMIRKFNENELKDLLIDNEINASNKDYTDKLIDYLAILKQNNDGTSEWVYCVKSIYDKDIDTAKVEFLFGKDSSEENATFNKHWENTKKKLDEIFFLGQSNDIKKIKCLKKNASGEDSYCSCDDARKCNDYNKNVRIIQLQDYN